MDAGRYIRRPVRLGREVMRGYLRGEQMLTQHTSLNFNSAGKSVPHGSYGCTC